ncbi:MAG: hypothetical protein K0S74_821 [Chlamydiales bacterium]|jgi:hypothetical protein|nr:hypothetical protein [Chlamydiales bacterium]
MKDFNATIAYKNHVTRILTFVEAPFQLLMTVHRVIILNHLKIANSI